MRIWLALALHVIVFGVGVWDIVAIARRRPQDTVSATIYDWSTELPILPFALGVVLGHLLWPLLARRSDILPPPPP